MESSSKMCANCKKSFPTHRDCMVHELTCFYSQEFQQIASCVCAKCGKSFTRSNNRIRHEATCGDSLLTQEFTRNIEFICSYCGKAFDRPDSRFRHENACKDLPRAEFDKDCELICGKCGQVFTRKDNRLRHEIACKVVFNQSCRICETIFTNVHNYFRHSQFCNSEPPLKKFKREPVRQELLALRPDATGFVQYETSFRGRLKSYFIRCDDNYDMPLFFNSVREDIVNKIIACLREHTAVKVNMWADCVMVNQLGETIDTAFKTRNKAIFKESDINKILDNFFSQMETELSECELKKSGWRLYVIDGLRLKVNQYKPLRGSTYIDLPDKIKNRKACVNIRNNDYNCFKYSLLAKFIPIHPERISNYSGLRHNYDFSCIHFPTPLNEIKTFEASNNISINVFGVDDHHDVYPLKVVKEELADHRDLLLLEDGGKEHYVYIKNFNKLVSSQITKHEHQLKICKRCFTHFYSVEKYSEHLAQCSEQRPARIELPGENSFISFQHVERTLRVPYVVYADFECYLEPILSCQPNPLDKYTLFKNIHRPISYCIYIKKDNNLTIQDSLSSGPIVYRGPDAASHFLKTLRDIALNVETIYKRKLPMIPLTESEKQLFNQAAVCYMCNLPLDGDKVRDHCHLTGRFRGAAHSNCNLRYQNPNFLPVFLHNMSGYDSHLFVRELGYDEQRIDVIPNTEEKYITFSKYVSPKFKIRFVDSYRFLSDSLDSLAETVPDLPTINSLFRREEVEVLKRKGVFPYEYMTGPEIYKEEQLPPKEKFFSSLRGEHITDEQYSHARKVWGIFQCKTLGDYNDLYMKTDVLLLTDIFETFRDITIKSHKLDPAHFFTVPAMTWDAMLKFTNVKLELLNDYNMILMIERGIRGGFCQVSHRFAKANNKGVADYNPQDANTYIFYEDCNNLYGAAMCKPLPIGEFEWVDPSHVIIDELNEYDEIGFILDVDLFYPSHLHDIHNDLPFLPESTNFNDKKRHKKLIAHFKDKQNYVVHYLTLKQALDHGVILKKINRVLKFRQSCWLKDYIIYNTELRKKAKNDFEADQIKLYINAIFGKTMENIRKRIDIKLVSNANTLQKLINKPHFKDRTIYNENLAAVHMEKIKLKFDKPIYVGMAILDISKTIMYTHHYEDILEKYSNNNIKLMYMDTDSFIYFIKTDDLFKDILDMKDLMDTSNYPAHHPCFSIANKKVMGKFKDEAKGGYINTFIGLRPKMYFIQMEGNEIKKIKGINKNVVKKQITLNDFMTCLREQKVFRHDMMQIKSHKHIISTVEVNKLSLSPYDDKRVILEDGESTLAFGHYRLDE